MDAQNLEWIRARMAPDTSTTLSLLMDYAFPGCDREVPDPYYGNREGFVHVFDLLEEGCSAFLQFLARMERQ